MNIHSFKWLLEQHKEIKHKLVALVDKATLDNEDDEQMKAEDIIDGLMDLHILTANEGESLISMDQQMKGLCSDETYDLYNYIIKQVPNYRKEQKENK